MACKPNSSSEEALKKLEEQLTCSICLDNFTNPKVLPCSHSFCLQCLQGVIIQNNHLTCPTCRLSCPVPDNGLATLPPSFVINNLFEVYSLMKKVSGDQHASCDNCEKNNADRYCKQCAKFLCPQCLHIHSAWKDFAGHRTISLEEVASTAHQQLQLSSDAQTAGTQSDATAKIVEHLAVLASDSFQSIAKTNDDSETALTKFVKGYFFS